MTSIRTLSLAAAFLLATATWAAPSAHAQAFFYGGPVTGYSYQGYGVTSGAYGYGGYGVGYGSGFYTGSGYYSPGYYAPGYYGGAYSAFSNGFVAPQTTYSTGSSLPFATQPTIPTAGANRVGGMVPYIPRLNAAVPTLRSN